MNLLSAITHDHDLGLELHPQLEEYGKWGRGILTRLIIWGFLYPVLRKGAMHYCIKLVRLSIEVSSNNSCHSCAVFSVVMDCWRCRHVSSQMIILTVSCCAGPAATRPSLSLVTSLSPLSPASLRAALPCPALPWPLVSRGSEAEPCLTCP